jgi:hypothetical protein
MKRPKQLPAVERKSTKCSSVPGGKVGPSWWGSDIFNAGKDILGTVGPALPGILSAL